MATNLPGFLRPVKPAGLTPILTLLNLVVCVQTALPLELEDFPWHAAFSPQTKLSFVSDEFKSLDRIGGTISHLENEQSGALQALKERPLLRQGVAE